LYKLIINYFNFRVNARSMKMDSNTAAKEAGLVLSDRTIEGISRKMVKVKTENGEKDTFYWDYFHPNGKQLKEKERIDFFNTLVVPPAWVDVWFCPNERGHIQATGKDVKGRTQYRYHPDWVKKKSDLKFSNIDEFAEIGLVNVRDRVSDDLKMEKMTKHKSTALVIKLMDLFHIRVGSDQYARENDSYGLTTIKEGHLKLLKGKEAIEGEIDAIFDFTGKSGKRWRLLIEDDVLVSMIEESKMIGNIDENEDLFMFLDENDIARDLKAEHINEYLNECTDADTKYTAKDFRTWAASWKTASRLVLISEATKEEINQIPDLFEKSVNHVKDTEDEDYPVINWKGYNLKKAGGLAKLAKKGKIPGNNKKERLASMLAVIDTVAGDLGNTRAVCRSSYIRPMILDDWENEIFMDRWNSVKSMDMLLGLSEEESITALYMKKYE